MSAINIDQDELKRVAVHESGHAVMAVLQGIQCHGVFLAYEPDTSDSIQEARFCVLCGNKPPWQKADYLQSAAGAAAEKLFFGEYNRSASEDDREVFSPPGAPEWEATVDEAKMILSESPDVITKMAEAIMAKHQQAPMNLWPDRGMDGTSTRFKEMLNEEDVRQIVATVKLMQLFRPFVGMLFFAPDNPEPTSIRFNGTASFVNTGTAKVIVTNGHVYKRFVELKQQEPSLKMFITGSVTNQLLELKEEYLVDYGKNAVDLAVFSFSKPDQLQHLGKQYFPARPWPTARPNVGMPVVIPGFQGVHRQIGDGKLTINLTVFCDRVSSSSDRHFVLVDEGQERIVVRINASLDELGPLGGVSGSPVFTMDSENHATLVGFLYETGEGADATIFAVHADLLTAEGKINHALISW
ncbi:MAG TPA: hypothetical protein VGS27_02540 [Candidatus Sulfotelmatobacter sp.]|nr:hypothetical protein [Candidatus Sulfotelmatobacter sp.]